MSSSYNVAQPIAGSERITLNAGGAVVSVSRKYFFFKSLASTIAARDNLSAVSGLPVPGSAHPLYTSLLVQPYEIVCGEGAEKEKFSATVVWSLNGGSAAQQAGGYGGDVKNIENNPPPQQAEIAREYGYATSDADLITDQVDGTPVLNSAGDPFDSVPRREVSDPVIRRVVRSNDAPSTYKDLNAHVNAATISVDGFSFPVHGALLRVSSRALWADPDGYLYEHTFEITGRTNIVEIAGTPTDIGWDFAFVDAGLSFIDSNGDKVRATEPDEATGEAKPTSAPVLLDGAGGLLDAGDPIEVVRVATYPECAAADIEALFPAVPRPVTTTTTST